MSDLLESIQATIDATKLAIDESGRMFVAMTEEMGLDPREYNPKVYEKFFADSGYQTLKKNIQDGENKLFETYLRSQDPEICSVIEDNYLKKKIDAYFRLSHDTPKNRNFTMGGLEYCSMNPNCKDYHYMLPEWLGDAAVNGKEGLNLTNFGRVLLKYLKNHTQAIRPGIDVENSGQLAL